MLALTQLLSASVWSPHGVGSPGLASRHANAAATSAGHASSRHPFVCQFTQSEHPKVRGMPLGITTATDGVMSKFAASSMQLWEVHAAMVVAVAMVQRGRQVAGRSGNRPAVPTSVPQTIGPESSPVAASSPAPPSSSGVGPASSLGRLVSGDELPASPDAAGLPHDDSSAIAMQPIAARRVRWRLAVEDTIEGA